LSNFQVGDNNFSGTLPSFATCTALTIFYCNTNSFDSYAGGAWALTCTNWRAGTCALNLAAVDAILTEFTAGVRPGAGTILLNLGTNAVPTPAVKAACVAARPGWTITTA
jgi:hypothetical protein